jgi:DNA-binding LacI/PurR family transcriptional regulator
MAVTIKDIAKKAGVSHSTVSRALSGNPSIAEETAERIRRAAVELGYLASGPARSLKTNRSHVLGVVVSSLDDPFFSGILQGIEEGAQEAGYSLFIAASQRDPVRERRIVQALVEHRADGVIICSSSFGADTGLRLLQYGLPIVVVNNQAAESFRYSIYHDDVDGSRQLARHLIELGHRRIAYLGNALSGRTTLDRLNGLKMELEAAGLPLPAEYIVEAPGGDPETGLEGAATFLRLPHPPTALLCFNDMLAMGVLKGLQQAGVRVPQEMSVAGFDNIVFSAFTNPPLTTFDQPRQFLGLEAARLVLGLLNPPPENGSPPEPKVSILRGRLLVRESTAPPCQQENL